MFNWHKRENDFIKRTLGEICKLEKEIVELEKYLYDLKKNKDVLLFGLKEQCPHDQFTQSHGKNERFCDVCNFSEIPDIQGNYKKLLKGKILKAMPVFGLEIQYIR